MTMQSIGLSPQVFRPKLSHDRRDSLWSSVVREVQQGADHVPHTTNLKTWKTADKEDTIVKPSFHLIYEVEHYMANVLTIRNHLNRDVEHDNLPRRIIQHVKEIFGQLCYGVLGWKEFILSLRSLFHATLELTAFIAWAKDVWRYPMFERRRVGDVWGAIFETFDSHPFLAFASTYRLPVYLRLKDTPLPCAPSSLIPLPRTLFAWRSCYTWTGYVQFPSSNLL